MSSPVTPMPPCSWMACWPTKRIDWPSCTLACDTARRRCLQPCLGLLRAVAFQQRAEQRQVVGVRARAGADATLVLGIGESGVGVHVLGLHGGLVVDHDARAWSSRTGRSPD